MIVRTAHNHQTVIDYHHPGCYESLETAAQASVALVQASGAEVEAPDTVQRAATWPSYSATWATSN